MRQIRDGSAFPVVGFEALRLARLGHYKWRVSSITGGGIGAQNARGALIDSMVGFNTKIDPSLSVAEAEQDAYETADRIEAAIKYAPAETPEMLKSEYMDALFSQMQESVSSGK